MSTGTRSADLFQARSSASASLDIEVAADQQLPRPCCGAGGNAAAEAEVEVEVQLDCTSRLKELWQGAPEGCSTSGLLVFGGVCTLVLFLTVGAGLF